MRTWCVTVAAAALACAGNPGPGSSDEPCALTAADSVHLAGGPVYRTCAVDRAARLIERESPIDLRPPTTPPTTPGMRCYEAVVEGVVSPAGTAEPGTWRLVRANDGPFGDAVVTSIPGWRWEPARKEGEPVRQIARETRRMAALVTVVRAGQGAAATPPPGPPRC